MGDPRKQVNSYSTPRHPWESDRLEEEKILLRDYGLKNKKELWKQATYIKNIKNNVKRLLNSLSETAQVEREALLAKLIQLNLIKEGDSLDLALDLTAKDILERRLQTQVVRQGLARTMRQARQFIVHGHIKIAGTKVTAPSYVVNKEEQFSIEFQQNSRLSDPEHPERNPPEVAPKEISEVEEKTEEEKVDEEVEKKIAGKLDIEEKVEVNDGE